MAVSEISLTRALIEEIVGTDQRKVRFFEELVRGSILSDEPIDGWSVTRWRNGKIRMTKRITTQATFSTFDLPFTLEGDLDGAVLVGASYGSTTAENITIKFANLTKTTVDIGATINGVLSAVSCSIIVEGRWKDA